MKRISPCLATFLVLLVSSCADRTGSNSELARAGVRRWAEKLDSHVTKHTGEYIRHVGEKLPETDPWGNNLLVNYGFIDYSQNGVSEILIVRSAGKDGTAFSDDDIVEIRQNRRTPQKEAQDAQKAH